MKVPLKFKFDLQTYLLYTINSVSRERIEFYKIQSAKSYRLFGLLCSCNPNSLVIQRSLYMLVRMLVPPTCQGDFILLIRQF